MLQHSIFRLCLVFVVAGLAGCTDSFDYKVAEFTGTLLVDGQPVGNVGIRFVPDVMQGNEGPPAMATTDAQGRFTLRMMEGDLAQARDGAVVGWNRVVLTDYDYAEAADYDAKGLKVRFSTDYTLVGSTPLTWEVIPEPQDVEISLPKP